LAAAGVITMTLAYLLLGLAWLSAVGGSFIFPRSLQQVHRAIFAIFLALMLIGVGWFETEHHEKPPTAKDIANEIAKLITLRPNLTGTEPTEPTTASPAQKPNSATLAGLGPPMKPCIVGEIVHPTANTFLLDVLVVEDGPAVQAIVSQSPETNHGAELLQAITSDEIKRFSGAGQLSVGVLGITPQGFPSQVPYLQGSNICQGMATTKIDDGVLKFLIPVRGAQYQGQSSIVLPRMVLSAARRPHICVEADFPLHRRGLIEGPYVARENVRCGFPGNSPGTTLLEEYVRRGLGKMGLIMIRRST
jgi:hypothetical protein